MGRWLTMTEVNNWWPKLRDVKIEVNFKFKFKTVWHMASENQTKSVWIKKFSSVTGKKSTSRTVWLTKFSDAINSIPCRCHISLAFIADAQGHDHYLQICQWHWPGHSQHSRKSLTNSARNAGQGGGKRKGRIAIYLKSWHADVFTWLDLVNNLGNEADRALNFREPEEAKATPAATAAIKAAAQEDKRRIFAGLKWQRNHN